MTKLVKYLWLALSGVAALLVAVVLVFALTFNANRYKDDIERIAKERTGRTLKLQGELKLAVFPSLGASIAGVTLSERGSGREFVRLESAHASVKLLPLLHGQVIVEAVRVSGLRAQLVKNKDGSYNFSDLLEGKAEKPAPRKKDQSTPVIFDIAGVDIDRAAVAYRDTSTGQEISLSDLEVHTGRIADSIGVDFTARLDESSIRGKLAMARTAQPSYRFDLDIDRLDLDRYLAAGENKPDAAVDLSGLKGLNAQGQLQIGALQVQGFKLSKLKAQLKAAGGRAEISPHSASLYEGELSGALSLDGNANRIALKETLSNFSIKNGVAHNEDLDVKSPLLRIGGSGDIDIGRSAINYVVRASVVGTTSLTVPVKLAGPLDAMKYEVDYRAVAGDLAKSKVGDKVRDRLKGLLGR